MSASSPAGSRSEEIVIPPALHGKIELPGGARALVVFAHGSGSSRLSPRNRGVAAALRDAGLGTLLFDLLAEEEAGDRRKVFDIGLLATRLEGAVDFVAAHPATAGLPLGLFGASTGAAAALAAAAARPAAIGAVVSRGGRPDLASEAVLQRLAAPTLFIVGGEDREVLELNRRALARMSCTAELAVVPGATHLFEEPGALGRVAQLAAAWFRRWLTPGKSNAAI